jgi:aerobic-type carbon monoxide dehydrogenase small subunit (CoxS/CutS family)
VTLTEATETQTIRVTVNGTPHQATVEPRLLLADLLREELGLLGTHLGCEHGVCGACTVLLDGEPARSCLLLAVQVDGRELITVEGLANPDGALHPLQEAFQEHHALQCGFCTPGFLLTALHLIEHDPAIETAGEKDLRDALSGNLCRCTGYQNIVDAVRDGAARLRVAEQEEA